MRHSLRSSKGWRRKRGRVSKEIVKGSSPRYLYPAGGPPYEGLRNGLTNPAYNWLGQVKQYPVVQVPGNLNALFEGMPFAAVRAILNASTTTADVLDGIAKYNGDPAGFEASLT